MNRSTINAIIADAEEFVRARGFCLPPFAYWTIDEWQSRQQDVNQLIERGLGWDITDFGLGRFAEQGLTLFTVRNGRYENIASGRGQIYAEKVLVVNVEQVTPLHFHWRKTEDIINRGGGLLAVKLYKATERDELDTSGVAVSIDSIPRQIQAGDTVILKPGESITLPPRLYHAFWALEQRVLVGEVSSVNDDAHDNHFYEAVGRFPSIHEDVAPTRLLVSDYATYLTP